MTLRNISGTCPITSTSTETITLSHGEGGPAMRRLIRERIASKLSESDSNLDADAATLGRLDGIALMTTDSFVVSPLFFPGGDIGSLAVYGTVNDLAMAGAIPKFMTLSLILEEGLATSILDRVIDSVAASAASADVRIVAGDTKVVPKGVVDGMFINTAGVGIQHRIAALGVDCIKPGDAIFVSGPISDHGFAVLSTRESLGFDPTPKSDSRPLHQVACELIDTLGDDLHAMRDATRGGVAAVLHEWAEASGHAMWIDEREIPLRPGCRGISELLGIDPLYVANEGTFVAAIAGHRADDALEVLRKFSLPDEPSRLGEVRERDYSPVLIRRGIRIDQPLDEPVAAMLPRIC